MDIWIMWLKWSLIVILTQSEERPLLKILLDIVGRTGRFRITIAVIAR